MTEIFFGNLPRDIRRNEVEDFFRGFGKVLDVDIKKGFAFVTIEDKRDAEDAVRKLDGHRFCQSRVTVDISKGRPTREEMDRRDRERDGGRDRFDRDRGFGGRDRFDDRDRRDDRGRFDDRDRRDRFPDRDDRRGGYGGGRDRFDDDRRGGFGGRDRFDDDRRGGYGGRDRYGDERRGAGGFGGRRQFDNPKPQRTRNEKTKWSLTVHNLSSRTQWWDLKDLAKKYGNVVFADANKHKEGEGILCFDSKKDCEVAMDRMQGEELFGKPMDLMYEYPEEFENNSDGDRSRSRSPVRGRSRSASGGRYSRSRSDSR